MKTKLRRLYLAAASVVVTRASAQVGCYTWGVANRRTTFWSTKQTTTLRMPSLVDALTQDRVSYLNLTDDISGKELRVVLESGLSSQ
jgi:hypothetical protein